VLDHAEPDVTQDGVLDQHALCRRGVRVAKFPSQLLGSAQRRRLRRIAEPEIL
jgi:hypothetical protein